MKHALLLLLMSTVLNAAPITTNSVQFENPPSWLTRRILEKTTDRVEKKLEWAIRRVTVRYIANPADFKKAHGLATDSAQAVTFAKKGEILLGITVTSKNFDEVFAHELVHVILYQKFKGSIPAWLEEGLANWISGRRKVDYAFISSQGIAPIEHLTHPFANPFQEKQYSGRYHYEASTAMMEMLSKKCDMDDLIQLSMGSKLETYLKNSCEIPDLNAEFKKWIESHQPRKAEVDSVGSSLSAPENAQPTRSMSVGFGYHSLLKSPFSSDALSGGGIELRYGFHLSENFVLSLGLAYRIYPTAAAVSQLGYGAVLTHYFWGRQEKDWRLFVSYGLLVLNSSVKGRSGSGTSHDTLIGIGSDFGFLGQTAFSQLGYHYSALSYFETGRQPIHYLDLLVGLRWLW